MSVIVHSPQSVPLLAPNGTQPNRPLFIFLPGMDGSGNLLNNQLEGMKPLVDIRCAMIPPHGHLSWESLASLVICAIQQEHSASGHREVYVCGESFGACLALQVVMQASHLIDRLILVNSATAFRQFIWSSWAAKTLRWLPDSSFPLACSILMPFLTNLERVAPHDSQALLSAMQSVGYTVASQRIELLHRFYAGDDSYRQITQPTLLIAGGSDRLLPSAKESRRLAALIPDATVHLLPYSGHTCLLEQDVNLADIMASYNFGINACASLSCC
jgi:pimeloyl-ACP methyl ester carboxylesterase